MSTASAEQTWVLRRPLSASPKLLLVFMGSLAVICLGIACFWAYFGARWVLFFACIDVIALGVATVWCVRHALDEESVSLSADHLVVQRRLAGVTERWDFARYFARVQAEEVRLGPFTRQRLRLSAQTQSVQIGSFCEPRRLRLLEKELRAALRA